MKVINLIFLFSFLVLFYTWFIYPFLLFLLGRLFYKRNIYLSQAYDKKYIPFISIIIAAYNEEKVINKRIENLLQQDYPKDKLEIIVASDGSMDKTVEIAKQFEKHGIKVLDFKQNRGRAAVHNDAAKVAKGEILIFTDAGTEFEKNFIKEIIREFEIPNIGCVSGRLIFKTNQTSISTSEGLYWKIETKIRELENKLGIFASGTGACLAIRKRLFSVLDSREDIDDSLPLHVIMSGYKVFFSQSALAYDIANSSIRSEIKARSRMTAKGITGIIKRWGIKGWIKHPFVSWGLLSHKILRWFTPFFIVGLFISNIFLLNKSWFYKFAFVGQIIFYILAILGFIGELFKKSIPIASIIFSFCIANIGMGIGVIKGLLGKAPAAYKMEE